MQKSTYTSFKIFDYVPEKNTIRSQLNKRVRKFTFLYQITYLKVHSTHSIQVKRV